MLYERWQRIAREFAPEPALRELSTGRSWTFGELEAAISPLPATGETVLYPQGQDAGFILTVLRAWRHDRPICPLEPDQARPTLPNLPGACRLLKTTSATTGDARYVLFTAEQMMADVENIVQTMGLRRDSPNLALISLAHSYGFSSFVLVLLLHGIPLVIAPSVLPETLRQAAGGGSNWTLPAVPALWRAWHDAGAIPPNIRMAISAGAPLPLPLEQAVFASTGLKIHNFLGASECGGIAYDATDTPRTDAALAGRPMRNVQLEQDADGCLVVRGAAVGATYWPEPDARLANGVFRTADLVTLRDGQVFLRGRASDLINVAGRKVSPEGIEQALLGHPDVRECLVLGLPLAGTGHGEVIVAVVAAKRTVAPGELKQFLLARLPAWQVPRQWHFVAALNVNERGKLSRTEWRRKFVAGEVTSREDQLPPARTTSA